MPWFLTAMLALAVAFQIWVTVRVWRIDWFERAEKVAQSQLIWLLPILGAVMVYSVITDENDSHGPTTHLKG